MANSFIVDVAPEMQLYRILQTQSYGEETALSEFVDNSIQSFLENEEKIKKNNGEEVKFNISIIVDTKEGTVEIIDNAGGIGRDHMQQAIKMGRDPHRPHLKSSLSIYGMGLKSAAVWFSDTWRLETSAIDSNEKLSLSFNLKQLLAGNLNEIEVSSTPEQSNKHYTKITIYKHNRRQDETYYSETVLPFLLETFTQFQPKINIKIIHDYLVLEPGDKVFLQPNPPLNAQKYNNKGEIEDADSQPILWQKNINFQNNNRNVDGFVRLMQTGGYGQPGIRLLRNNRVIKGTSIKPNLPYGISGTKNKYAAQRIYGEIHLNEFRVNYQKTGFDEDLSSIYKQIADLLSEEPNLLTQTNNYRSRKSTSSQKPPINIAGTTTQQTSTKKEPTTKIKKSQTIKNQLNMIHNSKLSRLYDSLCRVSLVKHPILMYVGSWTFFETISNAMCNDDNNNFKSHFNSKSNELYKGNKDKKNAVKQAISDIHTKGNCNKHSGTSQTISAKQLINDFEVLEEFIVYCLREIKIN